MSDALTTALVPPTAQTDALLAQQQAKLRPLNARDIQGGAKDKNFDKVMQDYEGVFLSQMVAHMYEGVEVDPNFGGGHAEETMRTLLINEYGKKMAERGGIGLAAAMKKQLLAAQEKAAAKQVPPQTIQEAAHD